jgi:hypothetical protein
MIREVVINILLRLRGLPWIREAQSSVYNLASEEDWRSGHRGFQAREVSQCGEDCVKSDGNLPEQASVIQENQSAFVSGNQFRITSLRFNALSVVYTSKGSRRSC